MVSKAPQVIVKIPKHPPTGMVQIRNHLDYISREGTLALEDENGEKHIGDEGLKDINDMWTKGHEPVPEVERFREAIKVVLSMPPGTDREGVHRAVREFAKEEFSDNFQYVFAYHDDEAHPHVHLVVKSRGLDGTRLNPLKDDLNAWRVRFAEKLREQGIDASATRRRTHMQREKGVSQAVRQMERRGVEPKRRATAKSQPKAKERALKNQAQTMQGLGKIAKELSREDSPADLKLALDLVKYMQEQQQQLQRDQVAQLHQVANGQGARVEPGKPELDKGMDRG